MLRYGLERPIIFRIRDHLEGFRITCLRSQKLSGTLAESNKATSLRRKKKYVLSEDLLNWQTYRGHSVSPSITSQMASSAGRRLKLDFAIVAAFLQISPMFSFVAIFLSLSIEPTTPVPSRVASQ